MGFLFVILFFALIFGAFRLGSYTEEKKQERLKNKPEIKKEVNSDTDTSKVDNPEAKLLVMTEKLDMMSEGKKKEITVESKSDGKTEYRILFEKNYLADKWLQFKDSKGKWRLVPKELSGRVLNISNERECPKYVPDMACSNFKNCSDGYEEDLKNHTEKWTDIEDYFSYLRELHQKYKTKQEEKKSKNGTVENL